MSGSNNFVELLYYAHFERFVKENPPVSYKSARKLPQKRDILIVQVEPGKIIGIERVEL